MGKRACLDKASDHVEDPNGEVPWIMEHPIKTIDFMPKTNLFQVDTG